MPNRKLELKKNNWWSIGADGLDEHARGEANSFGQGNTMQPRKPEDIARQIAERRFQRSTLNDGMKRENFMLPRIEARLKAKEFLSRYPKAAYMTEIENWRELPGDMIEFTMRRLPSSD